MANQIYNKWNSRRWRVTVWAMSVLTLMLGYTLITKYDPSWLGIAIPLLTAIPTAYIGFESYTKTRMNGSSTTTNTTGVEQ